MIRPGSGGFQSQGKAPGLRELLGRGPHSSAASGAPSAAGRRPAETGPLGPGRPSARARRGASRGARRAPTHGWARRGGSAGAGFPAARAPGLQGSGAPGPREGRGPARETEARRLGLRPPLPPGKRAGRKPPPPRPPTCRREKRAVPGCSTREPQRRHSTAFRFRPSADTNSSKSSAASIAATAAGPSATTAQAHFLLGLSELRWRSLQRPGGERTVCAGVCFPVLDLLRQRPRSLAGRPAVGVAL